MSVAGRCILVTQFSVSHEIEANSFFSKIATHVPVVHSHQYDLLCVHEILRPAIISSARVESAAVNVDHDGHPLRAFLQGRLGDMDIEVQTILGSTKRGSLKKIESTAWYLMMNKVIH